jgi:hypothetical protein
MENWKRSPPLRYLSGTKTQLRAAGVGRKGTPSRHAVPFRLELADKSAVIDTYRRAAQAGWHIEKPPRTTWMGTPLPELWLTDPDGNLIKLYARLTEEQLVGGPADSQPVLLG